MFVSRRVIENLPLPGDVIVSELRLPVPKGYIPVLRRISYSLSIARCTKLKEEESNTLIQVSIQSQDSAQVREGGASYIGGIVIQPIITYQDRPEADIDTFIMPAWGHRQFLALEQRYLIETSYLVVSTEGYTSEDQMGLRFEYTQERLSDLEVAQAFIR